MDTVSSTPTSEGNWEKKTLREELIENRDRVKVQLEKMENALKVCPAYLQEMTREDLQKIGLYF